MRNIPSAIPQNPFIRQDVDPSEYIRNASIKGSLDLSSVRQDERVKIITWFLEQIQHIPDNKKVEYLEEGIRFGLLSDMQVKNCISEQIEDDAVKKQLGIYIAQTVEPLTYIKSFYEAWPYLGFAYQKQCTKEFGELHPEWCLMIAPFERLDKIKTEELIDTADGIQRGCVLNSHYNTIENSKILFELLLEKEYIPKYPIIDTVRWFIKNNPIVLFPYIQKLYEYQLITLKEIQEEIYGRLGTTYMKDRTKEDKNRVWELQKKLQQINSEEKYEFGSDYYDIHCTNGRKITAELHAIEDAQKCKAAQTLFADYEKFCAEFGYKKIDFCIRALNGGIPIFYCIDSLGLTVSEVMEILQHKEEGYIARRGNLHGYADIQNLLEWAHLKHPADAEKIEEVLITEYCEMIQDMAYTDILFHIDDIYNCLSEKNQQRLISAMNTYAPEAWSNNLRFAIEKKVLPLNVLCEKISDNPFDFIDQFNRILYHFRELKTVFPYEVHLIQKAKDIFEQNPEYIVNEHVQHVIPILFSTVEQKSILKKQLSEKPVHEYFIRNLIKNERCDEYSFEIRKIILEQPAILNSISYQEYIQKLFKIISYDELVSLIREYQPHIHFEKKVYSFLIQKSKDDVEKFKRIQQVIIDSNNIEIIIETMDNIQHLIHSADNIQQILYRTKNIKKYQSNIAILQQKLSDTSLSKNEREILEENLRKNVKTLDDAKKDAHRYDVDNRFTTTKKKDNPYYTELKNTIPILKKILMKKCEEEPFFIFEKDVIDLLGDESKEYVLKNINSYSELHPLIFLLKSNDTTSKNYGKLIIQQLLPPGLFLSLCMKHIRALAFMPMDRYTKEQLRKLPNNLFHIIHEFNPLLYDKHSTETFSEIYIKGMQTIAYSRFTSFFSEEIEASKKQKNTETFLSICTNILAMEQTAFSESEITALLSLPEHERYECLQMLPYMSTHNLDAGLVCTPSHMRHAIDTRLKKLFELKDTYECSTTGINFQTIHALSIYYSDCKKNPEMKEHFHEMLTHALSGTFLNWRTWGMKQKPTSIDEKTYALSVLIHKNLLPTQMTIEEYDIWNEESALNIQEQFEYELSDVQNGIRDILDLAPADHHIEKEELQDNELILQTKLDFLFQPLIDLGQKQRDFKKRLQGKKGNKDSVLTEEEKEEHDKIKNDITSYREVHEAEIKKIESLQCIHRLRHISLQEIEKKTLVIGKKRIAFDKAFEIIEETFSDKIDFLQDIRRIQELLHTASAQLFQVDSVSKTDLVLTDKVTLETHTFIGEKPVPSCQHYNGSIYNYGLLSYIADPAVKIAQIWDADGKIIARAIMRLLEDEEGKPFLFMERVYSSNNHPKIVSAVVRFGIQKAQKMGIGFYSENEKTGARHTLRSRGSRSAKVYTDAGGGSMENGVFTIKT